MQRAALMKNSLWVVFPICLTPAKFIYTFRYHEKRNTQKYKIEENYSYLYEIYHAVGITNCVYLLFTALQSFSVLQSESVVL